MLGVCSIMGLPWFVAATVLSISHVNSLKLESECAAPGEQPKFLGIREQRVTGFMIFVMMGCSVFMTSALKVNVRLNPNPVINRPNFISIANYSSLSSVHPNAGPVWSLSLHGRVLTQRHSGQSLCLPIRPAECSNVLYFCRPVPLQLFDRITLFGMPAKHQPDLIYLRYVPLWKVHVFTVVQLSCLIVLWVIKASAAAVVFPMMVRQTVRRHVLLC